MASEILDGLSNHKKIANILACKSTVYLNIKRHDEAILYIDKALKMYEEVFGTKNCESYGQLLGKKAAIYSEKKGEEFRAEDLLKSYLKWTEEFINTFADKKVSYYRIASYFESMATFIKIGRQDKVEKVEKEIMDDLKVLN